MKALKCDRCKRYYDTYNKFFGAPIEDKKGIPRGLYYFNGIQLRNMQSATAVESLDLCLECAKSFTEWLKEGGATNE